MRDGDKSVMVAIEPQFVAEFSLWLRGGLLRDEIKDVLQESLLTLWLKRDAFDPAKGTLRDWFAGIARRKARKWFALGQSAPRRENAPLRGGGWSRPLGLCHA